MESEPTSPYLRGVPPLSEAMARRLNSKRPLSPAERQAIDAELARVKRQIRQARTAENVQRSEPIEPEAPFGWK